jgi:hypothetical protein
MPFVRPPDQLAKAVTRRVRDGLTMLDAAKAKIEEAIKLMDEFAREGPKTSPSPRRSGRGPRRP